eukprot:COSAG01_NODE_3244_length_6360_cov_4.915988_3_plen_670_part_00
MSSSKPPCCLAAAALAVHLCTIVTLKKCRPDRPNPSGRDSQSCLQDSVEEIGAVSLSPNKKTAASSSSTAPLVCHALLSLAEASVRNHMASSESVTVTNPASNADGATAPGGTAGIGAADVEAVGTGAHVAHLRGAGDAVRWTTQHKPAHQPPKLIQKLVDFRAAVQAHGAELAQALELVQQGRQEAEGSVKRQEADTITALLSDIAEGMELVGKQYSKATEGATSPLQLAFTTQKRRQRVRLANYTETATELFSKAGDINFLTVLWAEARWLFAASAALLAANLLGRLWVIYREQKHVEEGKRSVFWRGAAVFMVETNIGMRTMKKALKDMDVGGTAYFPGQGYVESAKDAVAVAAENEQVAGRAEVQTIALMAGTEDIPQLVVQVLFLVLVEQGSLDIDFWFTFAGTIVQLLQRGMEGKVTYNNMERLKQVAEGRDKTFTKDATDEDVVAFVERCGVEVRSINMKGCEAITDVGVVAVAVACPHLTTLILYSTRVTDVGVSKVGEGCPQLAKMDLSHTQEVTDVGVSKVGEGCPQLASLSLSRTEVTDVGVAKLAEGCPQMAILGLGNTQVTDVGMSKVGEGCPQLATLWLNDTQVTDISVSKVAEGCPLLTDLRLDGTQVTDVSVSKVAEGCPLLTNLRLDGTQVTHAIVEKFVEDRPGFKIEGVD